MKTVVTRKRSPKKSAKKSIKRTVEVCDLDGFGGEADTLDVQSRYTIEERAYFKWLDAGRPNDEASRLRFWAEAEREYNAGF